MIPRQKRSILVYFFGMSTTIIIILVVFTSIALQHIYLHYSQAKVSEKYLAICRSVSLVVRYYGFERGRVNVVLNYQGSASDVADSVNYIKRQRLLGDRAFHDLQEQVAALPADIQPLNFAEVKATQRLIEILRERYQEQLAKPFSERDPEFDDLWFNTMSRLLRQLHYLLFHLTNNGQLIPEQKKLADIYYLLSRVGDYSGPVVSYLEGASYNPDSLNLARILEISFRHEQMGYFVNELMSAAHTSLDKKNIELVTDFRDSYLVRYFTEVSSYLEKLGKSPSSPQLDSHFLADGVRELEKINTISLNLVNHYERISRKALYEQKNTFFLSIITSLMLISLMLISLYLGYKSFYKRIIANTNLLEKLIAGDLDTEIPEPSIYDEIDLLQNGIQRFKDNQIKLNAANVDLLAQVEQQRQSEIRLRNLSDERGLLLKEVHHRVKNNLQVISSMMALQIRRHADEQVGLALAEAQRRVNNIAIAHQMLYESDNLAYIKSQPFFDAIITNMMEIYGAEERFRLHLQLDDFSISFETAKTLSLILGEALSNIHKHAFPDKRSGNVYIFLTKHSKHILLKIKDDGVGFNPAAEQGNTLGVTLIKSFSRTLQGEALYSHIDGTEIMINVKDS